MPRAYTLATAALALGAPNKWLDNVLSHYTVPGVEQKRQGITRRLSVDGLVVLGIALLLMREVGLPALRAIDTAQHLANNNGSYQFERLSLSIDLAAFRNELLVRLENAVEIAPVPKRGRPIENKTGRLD
ncbi:MAG: hypothetical protein ACREMS_12715 [Gemmatimonadaceae bacterium]